MTSTSLKRAAAPLCTARMRKVLRLFATVVLVAFGCLAINACARPVVAWAADGDIVNYGNPFENGDLARELRVDDRYFGYKMAGVTIDVGGIREAGVGPAPYAYPQVLVDYANAVREAGRQTGYGDWGVSDFYLDDVEIAQNSRGLKFSTLPTMSHCCQHDNETTYNYPRTAYLLLIDEQSWWSDDGSVFHGVFALMTRNLGATMDIWDQGTAGSGFVYADWVVQGNVEIDKESGAPDITAGNPLYSLSGATFGIYDAQGALVDTVTTDDDGHASKDGLAPGPYTLVELEPPAGFAASNQEWPFEIIGGQTTSATIEDAPLHNPIEAWAFKEDAVRGNAPSAGATLAGAEFTIDYFAGFYDADSLPDSPTRTWVVASDSEGKAAATDDALVSGDEFYHAADGRVALPLGTVRIRETKAPTGYLLADGNGNPPAPAIVTIDGTPAADGVLAVYNPPAFSDDIIRGGVAFKKLDRQSKLAIAQGAAQLVGACFEIVTLNDGPVDIGGTSFGKGDVVATLEAVDDGSGNAVIETADNFLPFGTYCIREIGASPGYVLDALSRDWTQPFSIAENGIVVGLPEGDTASNQVVRGDFAFSKVDGKTRERMPLVPFLVTSQSTGEHHVIVTDANGMLSTSASWNAHTANTNANDAVLDTEGVIDASRLDPQAGIWFSGYTGIEVDVDDSLGALPFDTYLVEELPASSNQDHELVSFSIAITRNAQELDLGTVDDDAIDLLLPSLATTAYDVESGTHEGVLSTSVQLVDVVSYENLEPGIAYQLDGMLMDKATGEPFEVAGQRIEASATFTPTQTSGQVDLPFEFDGSALDDVVLVAFERLNSDGIVVAEHADLKSAEQTVSYRASEPSVPTRPSSAMPRTGDDLNALPFFALATVCAAVAMAIALIRSAHASRKRMRR